MEIFKLQSYIMENVCLFYFIAYGVQKNIF